jgi:hypothetical protein
MLALLILPKLQTCQVILMNSLIYSEEWAALRESMTIYNSVYKKA